VRFADGFSPRELKSYGVLLVTGLLYLVIRLWMLEGARPMGMQTLPADEHLVRVASALSKYLQLTFVPFVGNSPHHSFKWTEQASLAMYWPQLLASFVLLAGITVLVARRHLVGWWLLVWLAAYLPVMQLVPLEIGSNIIHQRFMYFPTAVLLALSPYAVSKLQLTESAKRFAAVLASLAVAISIVLCWSIIPVWRSDFALWMWSVQADPDSVQARENLIWTYLDRNEFGKAEEQLRYIAEHGMQTTPNVAVNFGVAYYRIGRFDDALYYYKKAYEKRDALIPSQVSNLLSNMAIAYAVMGDEERTRSHVLQSLDVEKKNWVALSQLLAFCGEQKIDLTPYTESSLARASASAQDVRKVVARYQQVKLEKGDFCPFP
jgi:tetratricopeptide (TPR) repeat protein